MQPTKEQQEQVEKENGACVVISHPDGSAFMFKALTREQYDLREARARRKDPNINPDEGMLQLACVWPSRAEWNKYVEGSVFETIAYAAQYKQAFGDASSGVPVRQCDPDEVPTDGNPDLKWLVRSVPGQVNVFGFRKPARSEVKLFSAEMQRRLEGDKIPDPLEKLLRSCGSEEFGRWLDSNPFGIGAFGEAFVSAYGMQTAQLTPK